MKNNNISNRGCPSVLVKVEDSLIHFKQETYKDKIINLILGKECRAQLDNYLVNILYHTYLSTDLNIILVMNAKNIKNRTLLNKLREVPHKKILYIEEPSQIYNLLCTNKYIYYVDSNLERCNRISHKRCISIQEYAFITRGGYKFV